VYALGLRPTARATQTPINSLISLFTLSLSITLPRNIFRVFSVFINRKLLWNKWSNRIKPRVHSINGSLWSKRTATAVEYSAKKWLDTTKILLVLMILMKVRFLKRVFFRIVFFIGFCHGMFRMPFKNSSYSHRNDIPDAKKNFHGKVPVKTFFFLSARFFFLLWEIFSYFSKRSLVPRKY